MFFDVWSDNAALFERSMEIMPWVAVIHNL